MDLFAEVPEVSHTPDDLNCTTDENGDNVCDKEPSASPIPCECGTANPTRIKQNQNRIMYATGTEADILEILQKKTDQIKKLILEFQFNYTRCLST